MAPTATIDPTEVIAGPGKLYVAPIATTDPADVAALATLPSAWREVGYTDEGSEFTYDVQSEGVPVAEELDPVRYYLTSRTGSVMFAMKQSSRRNIALALNLGAAAVNDATQLEPPTTASMLRVKLLWISNDEYSVRGVIFRKCFNVGGLSVARRKAPNATTIPIEFRLEIPDDGNEPFAFMPNSDGQI